MYNFFKDSSANLSQWRLLLNGISSLNDLSSGPAFDDTRHASICVEVHLVRPDVSSRSLMLSGLLVVEISVCRDHTGSKQPLDSGQFGIGRTDEGT